MNCTLNQKQQDKLLSKVFTDLSKHPQDTPFDFKQYATKLYKQVIEKTGDPGLGTSYVSLLPQYMRTVIGARKELAKKFATNFADIVALEDTLQSAEEVNKLVSSEQQEVENLEEDNKEALKESLDPTKQDMQIPPPVVESKYVPFELSFLTDKPFEKDEKDAQAEKLYNDVKKKIISEVLAGRKPNVPGIATVQLTLMAASKIKNKHLRADLQEALRAGDLVVKKAHEEGVVLVLTDTFGNILYFNEKGEWGGEEYGKPLYYNIAKPKTDSSGKVKFEIWESKTSPDVQAAKQLAKRNKISQEDAEAIITRRLEMIQKMRGYILRDPANNQVVMDITGGTFGTPVRNPQLKTPVSALNLQGATFAPYEENGMFWIKLPGFEQPIQIEKPTFPQELAGKLAQLLVDDLQIQTPTGRRAITPTERKQLFEQFVYNSSKGLDAFVAPDGAGLIVKKFGKKLDLTDRETVKKEIVDYLTAVKPTREITKEQIYGRRVIKTTEPDYQSKYAINTVLEVVGEKGSRYFVIEPAKINTKKDLLKADKYNDFEIADGVLTKVPKSYVDFIHKNFILFNSVDADNNLVTLNPQFEFEPKRGELDKVYAAKEKTDAILEKAETKVPVNPVNQEGVKGAEPKQDTKAAINKLLNDVRDNPELNKTTTQAATKATADQIVEAKKWYEAHPLSKYFPFETMFNAVNVANSNSIATWTLNGITLYKGADYSDLYHEAWHGFTQTFLSRQQKIDLYNEARKKSGSFTDYNGKRVLFSKANDLQIEEYLAEDFREYMLSGGKVQKDAPVRNSIFRKIWNFLKALFGDSTVGEVVNEQKANQTIKELYDKLRLGDLTGYTFSAENRNFNTLNKGLQVSNKEESIQSLSFEDSKMLVNTVDALFSEAADINNRGLNDEQAFRLAELQDMGEEGTSLTDDEKKELAALQGKQTYKYSTLLFSKEAGLKICYTYVKSRLSDLKNNLASRLEKTENQSVKNTLQKKLDVISYALRNFGNIENLQEMRREGKDLIGYHLNKSEFVDLRDEELERSQETQGKNVFERTGVDHSVYDLMDSEIRIMLHGLYKTDESGIIENNDLGIPDLVPIKESISHIQRTVQNLSSPQLMYEALKAEGELYPPIKQLLEKMGPVSYPGQSVREARTWTKFWQSFNKHRINILLANLDIQTRDEEGKDIPTQFSFNIGEASADYKRIGREWEIQFSQAYGNEYIANDAGGNYLDLKKVLSRYPDKSSIQGQEFEFLKVIGVNLKDSKTVRDALSDAIKSGDIKVGGIHDALIVLREKVRHIATIFKAHPKLKLKGEASNYNKLQQLQNRYSDEYSDFMVYNAEGDPQSEFSQNTTLTQKIKRINEAKNIVELTSPLNMSYLRVEGGTNPWAKSSIWLKSLFDFDEFGGPKRSGATINVNNLGGVTVLNNGVASADGVQSASADEFTKMILDLHLQLRGTPELPRHADKKTSLSVWLSKLNTGATTPGLYIDPELFIKRGDSVEGINRGMDLVLPYLIAEMRRVNESRNILKEDSGVEVYDWDFVKRGSELVMFHDMLSKSVKERLYALTDDLETYLNTEVGAKLRTDIVNDLTSYFENQFAAIQDRFSEAEFISEQLVEQVRNRANKAAGAVTDIQVREAILRSFTLNNWIHNVESGIFFYGDPAQYNHDKEEYQKRIAAVNSTGDILRTDQDFINFVNEKLGKPYAQSKGIDTTLQPYSGQIHTAVLSDIELPSKFSEAYKKEIGELGKKYDGVNKADAACLVAFDTYRMIRESLGEWTDEQEEVYQKIVRGEDVSDASVFFPVVKMGYQGEILTDKMPLTALHKFAMFPLIPNVIKGTNLEKLHDKMMREDVGYVTFKSGSKVANLTKRSGYDKLYKEGTTEVSDVPFVKNTIFAEFLKDQVKVTPKFKKKITFYTQLRALISTGLMEHGVPTDFMVGKDLETRRVEWGKMEKGWDKLKEDEKRRISNHYRLHRKVIKDIFKLGELKKQELLQEVGAVPGKDGKLKPDLEKLLKLVSRELSRRDLAEHEIDFFQLRGGELKHDGSMSLSAEKVERVLQALVSKRLVRYSVNGEWLTQVSVVGFEKPGQEDDLLPPRKGPNGETLPGECKIAMQGQFKKLLSAPEVKQLAEKEGISNLEALNRLIQDSTWLSTGENRRMITLVGPRIPTQELNSTEFLQVKEFLPETFGNSIVTYGEITTKSGTDFDYDKLPMMMPNIQFRDGKPVMARQHTKQEARALYEKIRAANIEIELQQELLRKQGLVRGEARRNKEDLTPYNKVLNEIFGQDWDNMDEAIKENLGEKKAIYTLEDFYNKLNGTKAVESDILQDFAEILALPVNFSKLIRPNTTDTLQPIAEKLEQYVSQYNPKNNIFGDQRVAKGKPVMSGTRVFEYLYNLHKHKTNSVGKDTLGIAAVKNKYNVTENNIGLYLAPTYEYKKKSYRQKMLIPHNTIKVDGQDVISLSSLKDVEGGTISDYISETINGLVDIAKGDWINYIQGNKELAPILLFMFEAGVPPKYAAVFLSQPLIQVYVKEQKLAKSTFARVLGKGISNPYLFRYEAKKRVFQNPAFGFPENLISVTPEGEERVGPANQNKITLEYTNHAKEAFDFDKLQRNVVNFAKERAEGRPHKYTDDERAVFLHFLEIETYAKHVNEIQFKTNFDTNPPKTLYEAQIRQQLLDGLRASKALPESTVDDILTKSVIGAYDIADVSEMFASAIFKLRVSPVLNDFIKTGITNSDVEKTFSTSQDARERFVNEFRNDLLSYIFQNTVRGFDINTVNYKGANVETEVQEVKKLKFGAFVKEGKLFVDKNQIKNDFVNQAYSKEGYGLGELAITSDAAFTNLAEYTHFVYERETLRAGNPFAVAKEDGLYKDLYERNERDVTLEKEGESNEDYLKRLDRITYEQWLRNKALDNTFNFYKMFFGKDSYANQFVDIVKRYPQLKDQFTVVRNLIIKTNKKTFQRNLQFSASKLDKATLELYNENLLDLANSSKLDLGSDAENRRVAEFFTRFPLYAFFQSGLNTKSQFSLVRAVPQDGFIRIMEEPVKEWTKTINEERLMEFKNLFVVQNIDKSRRIRGKDYVKPEVLEVGEESTISDVEEGKVSDQLSLFGESILKPELTEKQKKKLQRAVDKAQKQLEEKRLAGNLDYKGVKFNWATLSDAKDILNGEYELVQSDAPKGGSQGGVLFTLRLKNRLGDRDWTQNADNYTPAYLVLDHGSRIRYIFVDPVFRRFGVGELVTKLIMNKFPDQQFGFSLINNKNIFNLVKKLGGTKDSDVSATLPALKSPEVSTTEKGAAQPLTDEEVLELLKQCMI